MHMDKCSINDHQGVEAEITVFQALHVDAS